MERLRTAPVARCRLLRLRIVVAVVLAATVLIVSAVTGCGSGGKSEYHNSPSVAAELEHAEGDEEAPTYYVKNGGNDAASGLSDAQAWATVAKVNASAFSPGQSIGFKRGDVWREELIVPSSGTAGSPITFTSYGTGAKPLLLGSRDLAASSGWTLLSSNKWRWKSTLGTEIAALHFNDAALHSRRKSSIANLTTQGDFYYDANADLLYLYSTSNPGTCYSSIEAAQHLIGVYLGMRDYVTVSSLDLRYWGRHGILAANGHDLVIESNDISYIGAGTAAVPLGNGIELSVSSDTTVRHNRIDECYDAGLSTINSSSGLTQSRIRFYGNVVSRCEYGFEPQTPYSNAPTDALVITGNLFYENGGGLWHDERPYPNGRGFSSWYPWSTVTNCTFTHNIIYNSTQRHVVGVTNGWTYDANRYNPDGSLFTLYQGTLTNFAGWQALGRDPNGSIMEEVSGEYDEVLAALIAML